MIKKIITIFLILIILTSGIAFANDGGPVVAGDEKLSVTVKVKESAAEIGGQITLQLSMQNNDKYPISFHQIRRVFENCYEYIDEEIPMFTNRIMPGSIAYYDVTVTVPENIQWYIENGKYYANIKLLTMYSAHDDYYDIEEHESGYTYEDHYNIDTETIPIEITNIEDGSHLVNISINEELSDYYIHKSYDDIWYEENDYGLCGLIRKTITVENVSGEYIDMMYIPSNNRYRRAYNSEEEIFSMAAGSRVVQNVKNIHIIPDDAEVPDTLPLLYQATFLLNGQYYGSQILHEMHAVLPEAPEVNVTFKDFEVDDRDGECTITITNPTDKSYENFVFQVNFYDKNNKLIPYTTLDEEYYSGDSTLEPNETIEFPYSYYAGYGSLGKARYGYIYNNNVYTWAVHTDSHKETGIVEAIGYGTNPELEVIYSEPTATPGYWEPKITPAPTPTAKPTPLVTGQNIIVEKTGERAAIPLWAYYALIAALAAAAIIIIYKVKLNKEAGDAEG